MKNAENPVQEKEEDKIKLKGGDEEINLEGNRNGFNTSLRMSIEGEIEAQKEIDNETSQVEEEEFKLKEDDLMGKENAAEPAEGEEEFKLEPEKEVQELTVSPYHGTTLELVKIEDLHLTYKVIY